MPHRVTRGHIESVLGGNMSRVRVMTFHDVVTLYGQERKRVNVYPNSYLLAAVAGSRLCLVTPSSVVTTRGGAWRPQYRLNSQGSITAGK